MVRLEDTPRLTVAACLALLLAWTVLSAAYVPVWRTNLSLWGRAVTLAPEKARVLLNFGRALDIAGVQADAEVNYRQAWALSESLPAGERAVIDRAVRTNLGHLALVRGDPNEAVAILKGVVSTYHEFPPAELGLAFALMTARRCNEAAAAWDAMYVPREKQPKCE
jgi:Flp pilus assembly protein TadD